MARTTTPDLEPGAVLAARAWKGMAHHYGLYVGNGRVIHSAIGRGVHESSIPGFLDGAEQLEVDTSPRLQAKDPDLAIRRAREAIGTPYHLWHANCEQFVAWCVSGEPTSAQKRLGLGLIAVGLKAGLALGNPGPSPERLRRRLLSS